MTKTLVIYHADCRDGWCAAWVAATALGRDNVELLPARYGDAPPAVAGRDVLILDYSWKRDTMLRLAQEAKSIRVLDHHKTAEDELDGLPWATFDMDRSGSGLTFSYFSECELQELYPLKWLVEYVEDRDLWRFWLEDSREVNAYVASLPYGRLEDLAAWNDAAVFGRERAIELGAVCVAVQHRYCEEVTRETMMLRRVAGELVPSVNAPRRGISELLHYIAEANPAAPFVHGWHQRRDGRVEHSLRSLPAGADVSLIAKAHGGGGHAHAAGFETSLEWMLT